MEETEVVVQVEMEELLQLLQGMSLEEEEEEAQPVGAEEGSMDLFP